MIPYVEKQILSYLNKTYLNKTKHQQEVVYPDR